MKAPHPSLEFADWLRRLRRARDLTQEALADEAGCAVHTLRAFESGRRRPSRELAARLAAALGVTPDQRDLFVRLSRRGPDEAEPAPPAAAPPARPPDLLATKLFAPPLPAHPVGRRRLVERLAARPTRLTLIVAPPGFGKSTLLAAWLAEAQRASGGPASLERSGDPAPQGFAWLSLDEQDDDPARFLAYLIAAVQGAAPTLGAGAAALLQAPTAPQPAMVLASLLNDLSAHPAPLALMLDDYHMISAPAIHEAVALLVDRAPPGLRLFLASRSDPPLPTARWRARGLLTELRAADLRFDRAEAAAFLVDGMGLPLSDAQVAALEARTEGWAAGLQLAGLSLQGRGDPEAFIAAFRGSNRFVLDYLAGEMLTDLPAHLRDFALRTSLLRRMCAPLCDALLGAGEASRALLAEMERRNLFLIPLDDEGRWWRYHHLFGDVLQSHLRAALPAEELAALHRRAAEWYAAARQEDEAIHHALAAGDRALTLRLMGQAGPGLMARGALATLGRWADLLPAESLAASPDLAALLGHALAHSGRLDDSRRLIDAAAARLPADAPELTRGRLAAARAHAAILGSDIQTGVALGRAALAQLGDGDPLASSILLHLVSSALRFNGDLAGALAMSDEVVRRAGALGMPFVARLAEENSSLVLLNQGRLREGERRLRALLGPAPPGGRPPEDAILVLMLALFCAHRGQLAEAAAHAEEGARLAGLGGEDRTKVFADQTRALICELEGDIGGALAHVEAAQSWITSPEMRLHSRTVSAVEARVRFFAGDTAAGLAWVAAAYPAPEQIGATPTEQLALAMLALGALDEGRAAEALAAVARLRAGAETGACGNSLILADLIEALAHQQRGQPAAARAALGAALRRAAPEMNLAHLLRVGRALPELLPAQRQAAPAFVDATLAGWAARLARGQVRQIAPPPARPPAAGLAEPLSERELEVLRLLGAGHSNEQIARQLVIAVGTVKRHLHSIFGKLDVASRAQAIARAHALGLLDP